MTRDSSGTLAGIALLVVLFVIQGAEVCGNPRNPCHPARRDMGVDNSCRVYRVPPGMCGACTLNETNIGPTGKFANCSSIYNIVTDECRLQLELYAKWNKCDKLRNRLVADFENSIVPLDYFVYSVCEECCDCVTVGSKQNEFWRRRREGTLFQYQDRANCGTHAAADICTVWPNVRAVVNWYKQIPSDEEVDALPDVCPILKSWRIQRQSPSLLSQEEREKVPEAALPFLRNYSNSARCHTKPVWQSCVRLEAKQSRI